jgi:hypothetical protein
MRRKKSRQALKYGLVAAVAAAATALFFLHANGHMDSTPLRFLSKKEMPAGTKGAGYSEEDRRRLERIIHEGAKDD